MWAQQAAGGVLFYFALAAAVFDLERKAVAKSIQGIPPGHASRALRSLAGAGAQQLSTGDRTVLGRLGRRGNKYLRIARDRDRAGSLHEADRPCAVDVARRDAAWRHGDADTSATCDVAWGRLAKRRNVIRRGRTISLKSMCSQVSQATMMSAARVKPKSFRRMGPIYN